MVSVSEMARQCGLSRSRFHQLVVGGTFPFPLYDVQTRRPFYPAELQQVCLEVRQRNCGINGRPVMFYAKRIGEPAPVKRRRSPESAHADLLGGLRGLGLVASASQVAAAMKDSFPDGVATVDRKEVLRAVFLHLRRQYSGDNQGR
jgi:hypothetical protein